MAVNIEALRQRLEAMNNRGKGGSRKFRSDLWTPDYGTYTVRAIPWPDNVNVGDTAPFVERWFYYGLGKRVIAPPLSEPDPVRELRDELFADRTETNLALARKLRPKMRCFLPIIVDATEDDDDAGVKKGDKIVKIWGLSQTVYKQLLGFIVDPDYGDITDPDKGNDIIVEISDSGKKFDDGTPIRDVSARPRPKSRPLTDEERALLANVPNINDIYPISTYEELESALNKFINGGPSGRTEQRGGTSASSSESPAASKKTSLDDAFDDLLNA